MAGRICFLNKHNTTTNTFKPHSHYCYELVYFLSGRGKITIDGNNYPIRENSYYIVPPHSVHTECIEDYGEIMFIGFENNSASSRTDEGVYYSCESGMFSLLDSIFREYKEQQQGYETAACAYLELFLISMLRNRASDSKKCKDLNYIKAYIEQYYNQKMDFRELSVLSGYSYDYFRHIFRLKFGISPQEHMINIRIDNAAKMLRTTNLSCTEVAYRCGFSNSAQMSAMFRSKLGISPSEARITDLYK